MAFEDGGGNVFQGSMTDQPSEACGFCGSTDDTHDRELHRAADEGRAAERALHALLEQAAELQAQGITVTAGRKHLQDTFNTTLRGNA